MITAWNIWRLLSIWLPSIFLVRRSFLRFQIQIPSSEKCYLFSEVNSLIKVILVTTATNDFLERNFLILRRVKLSILSVMTDSRLNVLPVIHIYLENHYEIDTKLMTNKFLEVKKFRIATFCLYQFCLL